MKTSEQIRIFSSYSIQFNHLKQCSKNGLKELRSRWRSFWCLVSFTSASFLQTLRLYATLGWIAGSEIYSNDRKFSGSVMLMVSLTFWWAHLFFDYTVVIEGWYYKNWFFWFFTNREELTIGFGLLGFFLICPLKWGYKYALCPLIVFLFSEVIYQSFQITHWTHFYKSMFSAERGWQLGVFIPVFILSAVKVIDYIAYTKYHLKDGNMSRITGMIKSPGLTPDEKMPVLDKLVDEYQNFNARI
jgi:hypothetical protein